MKKNINKVIALVIAVSVMNGNSIPVLAADFTQNISNITKSQTGGNLKSILTLDEAIKSAIDSSEILKLDDKKISYKDKINDINEKIDDNPQLVGKVEVEMPDDLKDLHEDTREVELKQCKQQKEFDEDKLVQKVTECYRDIVISQMKIEKMKKDIAVKNKELNIEKLKNSEEMITRADLNSGELNLQNLEDKLKSSESTLGDAEYNFKVLTGKEPAKYSLEQDEKFEKFQIDGSVDEYLDKVIERYLKYSTQLLKLNKDYLKDSDHKVPDVTDKDKPSDDKPSFNNEGDMKSYEEYEVKMNNYYQERQMYAYKLSNRLAYLNAKLETYEGETNLDEAKKQFKEELRNLYTMLLATEDNINFLNKNILINNNQLSISRLKCEDQLITQIDYDTQVLNSDDLDIQLRSEIDRYNTLKEELEKPWIAFSSDTATSNI